jgi:hypothetical protein
MGRGDGLKHFLYAGNLEKKIFYGHINGASNKN